ncbi:MAG TPA: proline--tRNA ligase [Beutenbergiaceae bacterium]|nr:proline--tRNA ligase [Beutenbergiaceae bacterium]
MSSLFLRTLREDPHDADVASHSWLLRAGYIRRAAPGIYTWLPLGLRVLRKIEAIVREEMAASGAQEVHFPALLPKEPYEATGRWQEYGPNLFRLQDRKGNDMLLAPTHEEMFTLAVRDMYSSYRDLPLMIYQIQTKYRDEARPRAGLLRGREFVMKDAYSFDVDDDALEASYRSQRDAYERIFTRLGLDYVIVSATAGAMGGSKSEEFLHPSPIGEDTFVYSEGGYAANVEAVTTPVPDPVDPRDTPQPVVYDTPDSTTIDTLVEAANRIFPREDRPWEATDTLKNVLFTLTHPDGEKEVIAIGLPGDRDVDPKRLEAAVYPAEVEAATDDDLATHPGLIAGYIGPQVLKPNAPDGPRYLLDPRVVEGTSWVTGANEEGRHVAHLVKGRDFEADGVIDVAHVKEGDPAPDGSGALTLARGIEIAHVFALGRKYAEALGLQVLDRNGKSVTVTMGSYGLGVTRVMAAIAEKNRDDLGLKWPVAVAPYQVHVVATGRGEEIFTAAEELSNELSEAGLEVLYDDRPKVSPGVKFADAEILGVPYIVIVGRGLAKGIVEVRDRRRGTQQDLDPAAVAEFLTTQVSEAIS